MTQRVRRRLRKTENAEKGDVGESGRRSEKKSGRGRREGGEKRYDDLARRGRYRGHVDAGKRESLLSVGRLRPGMFIAV